MDITKVLKLDLLPTCPLFEGDLPAEAWKPKIKSEIKPTTSQWNEDPTEFTQVIADFMSKVS